MLAYPCNPVGLVQVSKQPKFGDRCDWTTGAPNDGNEWKKYRVVPRAHPSRAPFLCFFKKIGLEANNLLVSSGDVGSLPLHGGIIARSCLVSKNEPKEIKESAKSDLVSLDRESQKSRTVQTLFRTGVKTLKLDIRTVQLTVLGLSARRPENTFRTLLKHFRTFWLF